MMSNESMEPASGQTTIAAGGLGVGKLLSETVTIYLSRFWLFAPIAIIILVVLNLINYGIFGQSLFLDPANNPTVPVFIAAISSIFINMFGSVILMGVLALAAYDTKVGRPSRIGTYFATAISVALPLTILTVASSIAMMIGFAIAIVPGLFMMTIWSVMSPSVVIDRAGFSGLSRSAQLTKGFRWPVLGFVCLLFVLIFILSIILQLVGGFGIAELGSPVSLFGLMIQAVFNGITTGIFSVGIVVLFARLKELKEGVGMEDLASVFD